MQKGLVSDTHWTNSNQIFIILVPFKSSLKEFFNGTEIIKNRLVLVQQIVQKLLNSCIYLFDDFDLSIRSDLPTLVIFRIIAAPKIRCSCIQSNRSIRFFFDFQRGARKFAVSQLHTDLYGNPDFRQYLHIHISQISIFEESEHKVRFVQRSVLSGFSIHALRNAMDIVNNIN